CEGFFGRIKNEMFYGRDWAGITLEKFICFLDRYIRWYNEKRIIFVYRQAGSTE
ncbi:IS3 family transposase, partial [Klebsiella pneumoniae]|uniref:IS3 family transposase n=1 Tax=Klebsiella pneumoniae TaxID=573 RepID=UPI000D877548